MNASDLLTTDVPTMNHETTLSKVVSVFDDASVKTVVITDDGEYVGTVTRRDLISSNRPPSQKVRTIVQHPPTLSPTDGVREIARRMTTGDMLTLPVLENGTYKGVVTADDLLRSVRDELNAISVADVYTAELVTVTPETSFGQAVNRFRQHRIRHLPVIADGSVVGMVSLADMLGIIVRELHRTQGGTPDAHMGASTGGHHGGFGSREGDSDDLLDIPIENVMTPTIETATLDEPLGDAVALMLERNVSSLVVDDGGPAGIVTKTDVIEALSIEEEWRLPVHINGIDHLDDLSRDELAAKIESVVRKHAAVSVLEAKVHLHEHSERHRGVPLLLARIRLYTDSGLFVASGEGFGARHATSEALNALERQLLDEKGTSRPRTPIRGTEWDDLLFPR